MRKSTLCSRMNRCQPNNPRRAIISIVDDDGSGHTENWSTGMREWLNNQNIPMTFAVPASGTQFDTFKSDLLVNGNDVIVHGANLTDDYNTGFADDMEAFEQNLVTSKQWAVENGYPSNICIYPCGIHPNLTVNYSDKMDIIKKHFDYGFTVNVAPEGNIIEGYESYYNALTKGRWNEVPVTTTMPDGFSKKLLLGRLEVNDVQNLQYDWYKSFIDDAITNQGYICFFVHSFLDSFRIADENGHSGYTRFQDIINYITTNYADQVEFLSVSKAIEKIDSM